MIVEIQDSGEPIEIGTKLGQASGAYYDGYMAEFVFVDGAVQDISRSLEKLMKIVEYGNLINVSGIAVTS